ncbi:8-amino-7-oxononanoate synthase isoform X1 [Nymphaea colorata]|uniref:8-amino-7-oxononanoate synthase isoform X1 n=1 Tax=Nymphaea colorata TaxID=210225 RepID=UPI00214E1F6A|nr:8-amino-7-oxononanoate synthase isoform X1 [Nymphaea colorata]
MDMNKTNPRIKTRHVNTGAPAFSVLPTCQVAEGAGRTTRSHFLLFQPDSCRTGREEMGSCWDSWVEEALRRLDSRKVLRSVRPVFVSSQEARPATTGFLFDSEEGQELETFDGPGIWDRSAVEVEMSEPTFKKWMQDTSSLGEEVLDVPVADKSSSTFKKLLLFSSNDYLGLSSHPTVRKAAAKAAQEYGMGPRGSALICGYTCHHRLLESSLAALKKKEESLLCPTGFAANMVVMATVGCISSLLSNSGKPLDNEKVAIFSDSLNHASIIDGIRHAERLQEVKTFVYRHSDMTHLNSLLSSCKLEKKVVVTDSLFSMDGDFAPIVELVELRRKHGFLLVIDDAHGTLVCGENGGGVAEMYGCEKYVDICVGTLSKAVGCSGGFIACSKKWKLLIQSRGRPFIFSTALPVPVVAAAHAAIAVAKKEKWRRNLVWRRVRDFFSFSQIEIWSPIISLVIGGEEMALLASRHLLKAGFHVTAIRPPTVAPNSCRLRITLSAAHTTADVKNLVNSLAQHIMLPPGDSFAKFSPKEKKRNGSEVDSSYMVISQSKL